MKFYRRYRARRMMRWAVAYADCERDPYVRHAWLTYRRLRRQMLRGWHDAMAALSEAMLAAAPAFRAMVELMKDVLPKPPSRMERLEAQLARAHEWMMRS